MFLLAYPGAGCTQTNFLFEFSFLSYIKYTVIFMGVYTLLHYLMIYFRKPFILVHGDFLFNIQRTTWKHRIRAYVYIDEFTIRKMSKCSKGREN